MFEFIRGKIFGAPSPSKLRQQETAPNVEVEDQKGEEAEKWEGARPTDALQAIEQTTIPTPHISSSARVRRLPENPPAHNTSKYLSRPTSRPGNLANTPKRKRFVERPDTYEVPIEAPAAELAEEEDGRPGKRARVKNITKSKPPIVQAKTSRGQPRPAPVKQTHTEQNTEAVQTEETPTPEPFDLPNVVPSADMVAKPKKGRGRPPKRMHSPLRLSEEPVASALGGTKTPHPELSQPQYPVLPTSSNPEEGISEILLNPSPVKPTEEAAKLMLSKRAKEKQPEMISVSNSEVEEDTQQIDVDKNGEDSAADVDDEPEEEVLLTKAQLFDLDYIDDMLRKVKHVGYNKENKRMRVEKTAKTTVGKRIIARIDRLAVLYERYGKQKFDGDEDLLQATEDKIVDVTARLASEYQHVMEKRLGDPLHGVPWFNHDDTAKMLTDIYFQIAVRYVSTFKIFARVHGRSGTMTTSRLQEFLELLDQSYTLLSTAINQRKESQPRSEDYQVQKPIRSIIPMIRDLRAKIRKEINSRAEVSRREEHERLRPERQRIQQEERLRDEAERRQQKKASNQAVRRALEAGLAVPGWGRLLAQSLLKSELKYQEASQQSRFSANTGRVRSSQPRYTSQQLDEDDVESNSFEDNHGFQRVSVFPARTASEAETIGPRPLSRQEKHIFIECMRDDRGIRSPSNHDLDQN